MDATQARLLARGLLVLNSSESRALCFHGDSMLPFLRDGDELIVQPVGWEEIRIGDIITYRYADKFPTRRVVRKPDACLLLWCESWPARRFRVARSDVLGRVVARARNGSWLSYRAPSWRRATRRALVRFYTSALFNRAGRMWSKARRRVEIHHD
jgi:hypothetical protein